MSSKSLFYLVFKKKEREKNTTLMGGEKALYGNKSITQLEFVQKVQYSLQELHNTGRSFPKALTLDFNKNLQTVTRTGASLYLMLFQVSLLPKQT